MMKVADHALMAIKEIMELYNLEGITTTEDVDMCVEALNILIVQLGWDIKRHLSSIKPT